MKTSAFIRFSLLICNLTTLWVVFGLAISVFPALASAGDTIEVRKRAAIAEMRRVKDLADSIYKTDLKFCARRGSESDSFPWGVEDAAAEAQAFPGESLVRPKNISPIGCFDSSTLKYPPHDPKDTGALAAEFEMRNNPIIYEMEADTNFENIVKNSFLLREQDDLNDEKWQSSVDYLLEVRDFVVKGLPADADPDLKLAKIKIVDAPVFLVADMPPNATRIEFTPGMVRGLYALCKGSLLSIIDELRLIDDCEGNNFSIRRNIEEISPTEVAEQANREQRCLQIQGATPGDYEAFAFGFSDCVRTQSAFVIAHELAHKYMRHATNTPNKEIKADDCGRLILVRAVSGSSDMGSARSVWTGAAAILLKDLEDSALGVIAGPAQAELNTRIARLKAPLVESTACTKEASS